MPVQTLAFPGGRKEDELSLGKPSPLWAQGWSAAWPGRLSYPCSSLTAHSGTATETWGAPHTLSAPETETSQSTCSTPCQSICYSETQIMTAFKCFISYTLILPGSSLSFLIILLPISHSMCMKSQENTQIKNTHKT